MSGVAEQGGDSPLLPCLGEHQTARASSPHTYEACPTLGGVTGSSLSHPKAHSQQPCWFREHHTLKSLEIGTLPCLS